jgi:hypothetical protein
LKLVGPCFPFLVVWSKNIECIINHAWDEEEDDAVPALLVHGDNSSNSVIAGLKRIVVVRWIAPVERIVVLE